MKTEYLFVYGTLRAGAGHPMHQVLLRDAVLEGSAKFSGRLFDLGCYPAAVPDPAGHSWIWGEVFRLLRPGELLARLDRYEGCGPDDLLPHAYRREKCAVRIGGGCEYSAWIYLYNGPVERAAPIDSGDYLARNRETR